MNSIEFDQFIDRCYDDLEKKQFYLKAEFGIGNCDKFEIDWLSGILKLKENSTVKLIAKITPIGSYSPNNSTWMWAWEYPYIPDSLKQKTQQLKELGKLTGMKIFATKIFQTEAETVWEIAAMACYHLKSMGCYRAALGGIWVFATIDYIESVSTLK
ncbi:MAG TPA: hypothetical protein DCZ55_27440 [Cyanobacteria bacterium UBA11371]|nr:hypothetical protein [Cyanobacteria bacterium UBA11371]HBE34322.1 hypothetical protein [Cyanobacteria bacterium UBA11368]